MPERKFKNCAKPRSKAFVENVVTTLPDVAMIKANTGTNPTMKSAHIFTVADDKVMAELIFTLMITAMITPEQAEKMFDSISSFTETFIL